MQIPTNARRDVVHEVLFKAHSSVIHNSLVEGSGIANPSIDRPTERIVSDNRSLSILITVAQRDDYFYIARLCRASPELAGLLSAVVAGWFCRYTSSDARQSENVYHCNNGRSHNANPLIVVNPDLHSRYVVSRHNGFPWIMTFQSSYVVSLVHDKYPA